MGVGVNRIGKVHYTRTLDFAGRRWVVEAWPETTGLKASAHWEPWAALIAGLGFTLLLVAYLALNLERERNVLTLVEERTRDLSLANQDLQLEIGERRRTEDALRESEARIKAIVDSAADGIVTVDSHGRIATANAAIGRMFGHAPNDLVGRRMSMLAPPSLRPKLTRLLARLRAGTEGGAGVTQETVGLRKDGSTFPFEYALAATGEYRVTSGGLESQQLVSAFLRDITGRKEVERMKNEFISTVSHELRTPLTSINAALGLVSGGVTGRLEDRTAEMIDIARNNCDRLVRLINDILDIEKIESGGMEYDMRVHRLMPLVEQAVAANRAFADQMGVSYSITNEAPDAELEADSDRLTQVLTNLLSNAAKFSPPGETVSVAITRRADRIRVAVADKGPGIAEDFRDRIFERFAQADSSDSRRKGGTGLGLNICQAIVEALGGRIDFVTEVGKGSTFFFELTEWSGEARGDTRRAATA